MRIKVCGNTAVDTALVAVDAGADMLGFIMAENTPRSLTAAAARRIVREMPPHVDVVGVFGVTFTVVVAVRPLWAPATVIFCLPKGLLTGMRKPARLKLPCLSACAA